MTASAPALAAAFRPALRLALAAALGLGVPIAPAFLPLPAAAQDAAARTEEEPTALFADSVTFDGTWLTATGAVEVLRDETRLTATRIAYNQDTGALEIDGPIRITRAGGDVVVLASAAEIDTELQNGIMSSARLVIDRQLQLAARRLDVIDGRYLRLSRSVASACEVCAARPVPLWEIRAKEVIHDTEERQIYFTDASFRLMGTPVLWLPRLRIPDPSLERASGFLVPELRTDSTLGTGVIVPYFITLGDHRDLTVSPYLATSTTTLNLRYRQAFYNGRLEMNGAVSQDDTRDGTRAYLFAEGEWTVGRGLTFGLDLRAVSDIAYLVDYGISDDDTLPSQLTLSRYSANEALSAELTYLRTLRASEQDIEDTLPFFLGEARYERLLDLPKLPGQLRFGLSASSSYRDSKEDVEGYDVLRLGTEAEWSGSRIFASGFRLDTTAAGYVDGYAMHQNSLYGDTALRVTPAVETRLSYPMVRQTAGGASEILTPLLQIGWSRTWGDEVPNIDSTLVEFDEGNLLSLSRFPGSDRRETGLTAAAGLHFAHDGPGSRYSVTLGRLLYLSDTGDFAEASGLADTRSDWLLGVGLGFESGIALTSRTLFDDAFELTKWEARLDLTRPRYEVGASYAYVIADAAENRDRPVDEFRFDGSVRLAANWRADAEYLYDFNGGEATKAGVGIEFLNECVRLRLGMSRRYSDTDALDPTTSYSFSVGFGAFAAEGGKSTRCAF